MTRASPPLEPARRSIGAQLLETEMLHADPHTHTHIHTHTRYELQQPLVLSPLDSWTTWRAADG